MITWFWCYDTRRKVLYDIDIPVDVFFVLIFTKFFVFSFLSDNSNELIVLSFVFVFPFFRVQTSTQKVFQDYLQRKFFSTAA